MSSSNLDLERLGLGKVISSTVSRAAIHGTNLPVLGSACTNPWTSPFAEEGTHLQNATPYNRE